MDTFVHIVYSSPEFLILFAYTVYILYYTGPKGMEFCS